MIQVILIAPSEDFTLELNDNAESLLKAVTF
jgi:hypothetical protein